MKASLGILRGELERLFSATGLKELCVDYLGVSPDEAGLSDESKAVFVRRLIDWCSSENAVEALADATMLLKKGMVDPRVKQIFSTRYDRGVSEGEEIGGFVVGSEIAGDDVGVMYECKPSGGGGDGDRYALWVINGDHASDVSSVQRFLTLMRMLKQVDSPSMQNTVTTGKLQDGRPFVVIGWSDGESLASMLPLPMMKAIAVLETIIDALEHVHARSMIHGDIRSENILVKTISMEGDGEVEVLLHGLGTDKLFSLGSSSGNKSDCVAALGIVKGMAPEVSRHMGCDVAADVYSLGALFYEMITGQPVFTGRAAVDVVAAHLTKTAPAPSSISEEAIPGALDNLVRKLMAKETSGRPRGLDEVRKDLTEVNRLAQEFEARAAQTGTREDIETWADALLEDPGDEEMLDELKNEARRCNAWGAAIEVMEEAALLSEDSAVIKRILIAAAQSATKYAKDYDKADQIYAQLLESDPDDEEINAAMLDLLNAQGKFEELIEKLAQKAETIEDPADRFAVIKRIAWTYEEDLREYDKAFDYFVACLSGGEDEWVVEKLEKIAERTDRFEDLATACGGAVQAAESAGDQDLTLFLYGKIGNWYLEKLDQPTYALTCFQKVLEYRPGDVDSLVAVSEMYKGAQQWKELAETLVRLGEAESVPGRSRDNLTEAAKVYYDKLSETDSARDLLASVLEEDPAHAAASEALATIYEDIKDWKKLTDLLFASVGAMSEGEEQVAARYRLGELFEDRLNDLKAAREQYEKATQIDSSHLDSIKGLERIYARDGDFSLLRDNLQIQLEIAVTPKQRMLLLERLAEISEEEFKDLDKAIEHYKEILAIDKENRAAMIALTRHYRKTERHEDLVDILQVRADMSADEEEKHELLAERAEIIRDDIGDAQRAAVAFQAVATLGGDSALEALAMSQEEAGDLEAALETLHKILDGVETTEGKVAMLVRIAKMQLSKMYDPAEAAATLRKAKDLAPEDRAVMSQLTEVLIAQGNHSAAIGVFEEELELVEGSHARAEIYARMGVIALEQINDEAKAIGYFEHALELNKNNLMAGDNVSTLYRQKGMWDKAYPIYEIWAASAEALTPEQKLQVFTQMGEALVNMDRHEESLKYFKKAATVADEPHLMKRLGDVAIKLGEFGLAKEQLERYSKAIGDKLSAEEKVELFVQQGKAFVGTDDFNDAAKLARQATVMAPDNIDARLLLAEVHEKRGDFRGSVEARQKVLATIARDDERWLDLVRDTSLILFDKLRDADGAANMLRDALEEHPDNRDVLGDMLKIFYATKRFNDVVDVVLKIASLVSDSKQLARYYLTVAKIYRRELKQLDDAVSFFNKAIDADPDLEGADEALLEILYEKKDWEVLEKYYKKRIAALPKDSSSQDKLALYEPMAELLTSKMDRTKDGIMLFEAISKLDPGNIKWLEKLSDLYGWGSEYAKKAIGNQQKLLSINPARVESFRMLYRINSGEEEPDQAWCAASMLALLNQASPDERKFYRDYQLDDLPTMDSRLKEEQWKNLLYHEELNQNISAIFSVIGKAIFKNKAQEPAKFGLSIEDAIDVTTDSSDKSQFVNFVAGSLGVEPPPLYLHEGQGDGFQLLDASPHVLVAGKDASALKGRMGLAFSLGQQFTLLRPGLFVHRLVTSGTELSSWLLASIKIFVQGLPVPADLAGSVQERLAPIRQSLDASDLEKLQGYVQSFVSKAADVNLKRWARSVDYTCDRAGLLLCGDVAVAVRVMKEQIRDKSILADRLKALTLFTVSDEHHKLRQRLGTALKNG